MPVLMARILSTLTKLTHTSSSSSCAKARVHFPLLPLYHTLSVAAELLLLSTVHLNATTNNQKIIESVTSDLNGPGMASPLACYIECVA
jgi:hypothetical protein